MQVVVFHHSEESTDGIQKQPPEVFLEISQNSQLTCARVSFLIKLHA